MKKKIIIILVIVIVLIILIVGVTLSKKTTETSNVTNEILESTVTKKEEKVEEIYSLSDVYKVLIAIENEMEDGTVMMTAPLDVEGKEVNEVVEKILNVVNEDNEIDTNYIGDLFEKSPIMYIIFKSKVTSLKIAACDMFEDDNGEVISIIQVEYDNEKVYKKTYKFDSRLSETMKILYNENGNAHGL